MTTFNKQELLTKFNLVKSSIAKNSTINALNNLFIRARNNEFKLVGCNGELQVTAKGSCTGDESFSACVDPSTFGVMLSAAKEDVQISLHDGKLKTVSARSKFNIPTIPGDMYPVIPSNEDINNNINIGEIIRHVYKAAPKVDVRNHLLGTCIEYDGEQLTAVATDGMMMITSSIDAKFESEKFSIIIPSQSAAFFASTDIDGFVVSNKSITATSAQNNIEIISKLIDARYPNWKNIVSDYQDKFTVSKEQLKNAVSIINKTDKVSASFKSNNDSMSVYCDGVNTDIDFEGNEFNQSYDPGKLLTCIDAIDSDNIEFSFDGRGWLQSQHNGVRFFIAPMRK